MTTLEEIKEEFDLLSQFCDRISTDGADPLFSSYFNGIHSVIVKENKFAIKEKIKDVESALEKCKEMAKRMGRASWYGKLIKKKAKKKTEKAQIMDGIQDLQKAFGIIQLFCTMQMQDDQQERGDKIVLWVDDQPENNEKEIKNMKKEHKVKIVCKKSTEEALEYLKENANLKDLPPSHFRVITDCYRPEEGDDAGEILIDSLRKDGWNCPVLVYCANLLKVMNLQSKFSLVMAATTPTQLDMFFSSMGLTKIEEEKEDNGKEEEEEKEDKEEKEEEKEDKEDKMEVEEKEPKGVKSEEEDEEFKMKKKERIEDIKIEEEEKKKVEEENLRKEEEEKHRKEQEAEKKKEEARIQREKEEEGKKEVEKKKLEEEKRKRDEEKKRF